MTSTPAGQAPAHTLWLQACGIFLCAIVALATLDMLAKDLVARHPAPLVNLVRYGTVLLMAVVLNGFAQIEGGELLGHIERLLQCTRLLTKYGKGRVPEPA